MIEVSNETFEIAITAGIDRIPKKFAEQIKNVLITWEEEPSLEQRQNLRLHCNQTLFGLYEGIPLTKRNSGYSMVLPDRITIFKRPIEAASVDLKDLHEQVGRTVWHEVAHYFGLDHDRIHALERKEKQEGPK